MQCEVAAWDGISGDEWLYVADNCDFIDSRGIARINLSDGKREQLVAAEVHAVAGVVDSGKGLVVAPLQTNSTDGEFLLAYVQCTYNTPCAVMLMESPSMQPIAVSQGMHAFLSYF